MFQTGQIGRRPQGMNAGNNMAFLQQARSGYGAGYNPFAGPAVPTSRAQGGAGGIGSLLQQFSQGGMFGVGSGGFGNIGALLQQFGGGMFGGNQQAPFRGNQQQMAAQMQQFGSPMASSWQNPMVQQQMAAAPPSANPMQDRMAMMQAQAPTAPRQMATQLSEADGRAYSAAAQQRRFGGGGRM